LKEQQEATKAKSNDDLKKAKEDMAAAK